MDTILPPTWSAITLARTGESWVPGSLWQTENLARTKPNIPEFCSGFVGSRLFVGITDKNREAHAQFLLPKAIAYSTGLLNYFFRGRLKMEFIYPDEGTPNPSPQIRITNLTANEALGSGLFTLLREDPVTTNRSVVMSLPVYGNYPGLSTTNLPFGQSFTRPITANLQRDGNLILVFQGTIGNEKDIAVAAVVTPGLCGNIELLANGGTNSVVDWGKTISFERRIINTNGTSRPFPLTSASWLTLSRSSPNVGDNFETPFIPLDNDGGLMPLRRGKWRLQPLDGGCVTVTVKSDGVVIIEQYPDSQYNDIIIKRTFECSIGGVELGSFAFDPLGGNSKSFEITGYGSGAWVFPDLTLRPGDKLVIRNTTTLGWASDASVRFYGGIQPRVVQQTLPFRWQVSIPLDVPPVPGDEPDPPPPPNPP